MNLKSFLYAARGLQAVAAGEVNFRIHLVVAGSVVAAGFLLEISRLEWCVIILVMSLVLATEAMNTAIEKLVNLVSPEYNKQAGTIKDISAGAVLLAAMTAVCAGLIIFLPKLF